MVLTRKIKVLPVGNKEEIDRVYKYLREGIRSQNKAMNQYISALFMAKIQEISKEDRHELNCLYTRISSSTKGSAYDETIQFAKGLPTTANIKMKVQQDFSNSIKKGLLSGKTSLPTYKETNPLLIHVDFVRLRSTNPHKDNGMYHNYENHNEFLKHLYSTDLEILIKFANNITFKLILGNPKKSYQLREIIKAIFEDYYKICGSSIGINNKKEIILNLSIDVPENVEKNLNENIVLGVDLGINIPAMCALNNSELFKYSIGSKEDFLEQRTKIQDQRKRKQKSLRMRPGGHGRKKKLESLEKLKAKERRFVHSYNHMLSCRIVEMAVKKRAKYINMERLKGFDTSKFILRNWSYYELQQMTIYKAKRRGIEVRFVDPYLTSQVCSCCGHWEEGQRRDQEHFECKKCGEQMNADFNAARNIAMSTKFVNNDDEEE